MATVKQREANRRNAQLSSGPKSQEGKEKVRLNAVKHGLRAEVIEVLPHEDRIEFARRLDAWFEEYDPRSEIEIHRVRRAAVLTWKIERADRHEIAQLSKSVIESVRPCLNDSSVPYAQMDEVFVNAADLASFDASNAGERLRRYQFALQRALDRTMDQLGEPRSAPDSDPGRSARVSDSCSARVSDSCSARVSDPAETADRRSPDLDSSTEAVSAAPIVAESAAAPACRTAAGGQGVDTPRSPDHPAPNKADLPAVRPERRTHDAPNKANSLLGGVKLTSAMSPKSPTRPIVREPKPRPADSGGSDWLDISIEKR
jgi:hypothetical protein